MKYLPLFLLVFSAFSQEVYFVSFKDKPAPHEVYKQIPQEKILRHWKKAIPLDERDLPVHEYYVQTLRELGVNILYISRWFNGVYLKATKEQCSRIKDFPFVKNIRKTQKYCVTPAGNLNTQVLNYGQSLGFIQQINLDCLHNKGYTGQNVKVGVFDSGFNGVDTIKFYDSLRARNGIFATWDFQNQEANVYNDGTHGMAVFSVMAANIPGQYVGGAPHANYFLARTEVEAFEKHIEEYHWLAAVEYGDSLGIEVINSSLGYNTFDPGEGDYSYSDMDGNTTIITNAADLAASKGIIVVTSAGNEGNSTWGKLTAPCDADSVLCVGAVDINGNYATFSSQGPTADGRIKPDIAAQGASTKIVWGSYISASSGTSFSSPVAASMVACLVSAFPTAKPMQIIDAIKKSASQANNPDTLLGYGIPDACKAFDSLAKSLSPNNFPPTAYPQIYITNQQLSLTLFSKNRFSYSYEILDVQGRVLHKNNLPLITNFQYKIPLENFPKGFYFVRIITETGKIFSHKFIKY